MKKFIITIVAATFTFFSNAQIKPAGLQVNDKALEFTAKDQNGKVIFLKDKLKDGKVALIFYRGQWCPYCNKELTHGRFTFAGDLERRNCYSYYT